MCPISRCIYLQCIGIILYVSLFQFTYPCGTYSLSSTDVKNGYFPQMVHTLLFLDCLIFNQIGMHLHVEILKIKVNSRYMQIFQVIKKVIWSELGAMFSHTNFSFFMGISYKIRHVCHPVLCRSSATPC